MHKKLFTLSLAFLSFFTKGDAQKQFSCTIHLPAVLISNKVRGGYDDGKTRYIPFDINDTMMKVKGDYYGRYATIALSYVDSATKHGFYANYFWVGEEPADIYILPTTDKQDLLAEYSINHAYCLKDMGKEELDSSIQGEETAYRIFLRYNNRSLSEEETNHLYALGKALRGGQMGFIRKHPNKYFSIWLFRTEIARTRELETKDLLDFFHSVFPDSLQKSPDGQVALKILEARTNARVGQIAPEYAATDIHGKLVLSKNNHGKYVLLDFWASWCGPCIEAMPIIKQMRQRWSPDTLVIISISVNDDRKNYDADLKKYGMSWTEIFNDKNFSAAYNVSALPSIFLIHPNGRIIYNLDEVTDSSGKLISDGNLDKLNAILTHLLGDKH